MFNFNLHCWNFTCLLFSPFRVLVRIIGGQWVTDRCALETNKQNKGKYSQNLYRAITVLRPCSCCSVWVLLLDLSSFTMPLHTDAMIAGVIALKLSPQRSNKNKNKDAVKILISVGWLTFDPVNSHPVDNPHRPPIGRAEKARFQFEYFRLRTRYRKDKRVSRDFARLVTHLSTSGRSRGPRITCRICLLYTSPSPRD